MNPGVDTKLAAARTRLILDKPFLGALVLRLPLVPAKKDWCPTTATDARSFYYNPEFIQVLSLEETQFMLAHEALHCALSHFARRQHRIKHRWDLACDYAINPLLVEDGLRPPPGSLLLDQYKGMTAEEIYPLIDDKDENETLDRHAYDRSDTTPGTSPTEHSDPQNKDERASEQKPERSRTGSGASRREDQQQEESRLPPPLTPDEQETLSIQWRQRMAGAAQQALQLGKLGGSLARMIDHLLQPQLPWRMLLARYLSSLARDDFSYMRPSRREGDYILPALRSTQLDLVVAVDISGSIKAEEIDEFLSEIDAIKGQIRARITLIPCDAALSEGAPWIFEPWEEFDYTLDFKGGGGTSFKPVFAWVEAEGVHPELLVYFTDAEGEFPSQPPDYPVIWLVKGKNPVPWGERIQLN